MSVIVHWSGSTCSSSWEVKCQYSDKVFSLSGNPGVQFELIILITEQNIHLVTVGSKGTKISIVKKVVMKLQFLNWGF